MKDFKEAESPDEGKKNLRDSSRKQVRGVSHFFPQKGDWDSAESYLYVSATSTTKEKMLKMRSHLLAN